MCISMFYAQVIGLWAFLVALAVILDEARFKKTVGETLNNPSLMTFTGIVALAIGLVVVVSHNVWVSDWPVVVTLVGWFFIFQGIMRLYRPEHFAKMMRDLMAKSGYTVLSWIWLLIGAYLIYFGLLA